MSSIDSLSDMDSIIFSVTVKGVVNLVGMEELQICFNTIELWYLSEFRTEKKLILGKKIDFGVTLEGLCK